MLKLKTAIAAMLLAGVLAAPAGAEDPETRDLTGDGTIFDNFGETGREIEHDLDHANEIKLGGDSPSAPASDDPGPPPGMDQPAPEPAE